MSQAQGLFQKIGVIGAGSFGTSLALLLHRQGLPVTLWSHDERTIGNILAEGENRRYLPGVPVPREMHFTAELASLREADLLVLATPSKAARDILPQLAQLELPETTLILSCTKGVERGTGLRMSEIVHEVLPRHTVAALSGPTHAEELARQMPAAVVIGCERAEAALRLQRAFSTRYLRAYTSEDVPGIELGGALKNIYAIAAGVSDGLGLGDNAKAALVTRALAELVRLGGALGGKRETFYGLSGVGDLMVTCFSRHSRNRSVGERLGRGETPQQINASLPMVAEGIPTTYSAWECARKYEIETPIIDQMRAVLECEISPRGALECLMGRDPKMETL